MPSIKNIKKTSDETCACPSWLEHWESHNPAGKKVTGCSVIHCPNKAEVGAHVQLDNHSDTNWYIIPLCKSHNSHHVTAPLPVYVDVSFAHADPQKTCQKKIKPLII